MHRFPSQIAVLLCAVVSTALPATAQPAAFVYRLGKDTVAVEQYTRTASQLTGEMVQFRSDLPHDMAELIDQLLHSDR